MMPSMGMPETHHQVTSVELYRPGAEPSGPSPVEDVRFAARFVRREVGFAFRSTSLAGHLLHVTLAGEVQQTCNGRGYHLRAGDLLWYHDDELVEGRVLVAPWIFCSVLIHAPTLPPPEPDGRLIRDLGESARHAANALAEIWMQTPSVARGLALHAQANALLAAMPEQASRGATLGVGRLWWLAEERLRRGNGAQWSGSLDDLAREVGVSRRSLERACRIATGVSPRSRIRFMRLAAARGLIMRSDLSLTAIAQRLGWPRVQELSRDYKVRYGKTPSFDRVAGLAEQIT